MHHALILSGALHPAPSVGAVPIGADPLDVPGAVVVCRLVRRTVGRWVQ